LASEPPQIQKTIFEQSDRGRGLESPKISAQPIGTHELGVYFHWLKRSNLGHLA